ncbi:hypothetical protein [Propionivibrio dicarboxylicus]|uniref:hypothetical protein n=1 Tax=Propionivibrio dicarboxylicus TaxID=83767 RepID=UPI0015A25033|nr:hypothetical protein [Propionivibrio dicarboxylicus]
MKEEVAHSPHLTPLRTAQSEIFQAICAGALTRLAISCVALGILWMSVIWAMA